MDPIDRKSVKLLALNQKLLAAMIAEALCDAPQRPLIAKMLAELRAQLTEFEEAYFDE
jgi:hypothetical protein